MQWKRRHCCVKVSGLLILLIYINLFMAYKNGWLKKIYQLNKEQQNEGNFPSPTRSLANVTHGTILEAPSQKVVKESLASNESSSKDTKSILKAPYTYIINEPEKCRGKSPFLVLMVMSKLSDRRARDAIRQTWGNESIAKEDGMLRLFVLGVSLNRSREVQHSLEMESQRFHDIIQQDYIDSYHNLTTKTLMGMHWVASYCPKASYVMKTDSDVFVNTEYLIQKVLNPKASPRKNYITGHLMIDCKPDRDNRSKWYMPAHLYPSESYPIFCSGTGYVFSADMARDIYNISPSVPWLYLEDVYVGHCLEKLKIKPTSPPNRFIFNHWKISYSSCKFSKLATVHMFTPSELLSRWQHLQKNKHDPCGISSWNTL